MSIKSNLDFEAIKANKNIIIRTYWKNRLKGIEWNHYFDYKTFSESFEAKSGSTYKYSSDANLYQKLNKVASTSKAKHMLLLAALKVLAYKYSSYKDICIFTAAYKEKEPIKKSNFLIPIRMNNFEDDTFPKFLMTLKDNLKNDFLYGNFPLEKILEKENYEIKEMPKVGMLVQGIQDEAVFDTLEPDILFVFNVIDELSVTVKYTRSIYNEDYIKSLVEHYFQLISTLFTNKEKPIKDIELISSIEKNTIMEVFNNTEVNYPSHKTILDFYEQQVLKKPERIAIQIQDKHLTYKELDEKSNQVANFISEKYIGKGHAFGVNLERSLELMITIFGILKSGHVYLPLSPSHPIDRTQYILENSGAKAFFGRSEGLENLQNGIDCLNPIEAKKYSTEYENCAKPNDIAYIIYTSGSTGKPKGVLIKHTSLVNRLNWMQNKYQLTEDDVVLQKTPIVFDVSVWELFWWSMSGAKLVLANPGDEKEPQKICEIIEEHNITTLHFVPSMLNALLLYLNNNQDYKLASIRNLFTSGEALKVKDATDFLNYCSNSKLHNLYGPTEATIDVSYHEVCRETNYRTIPIGRPIDNTQLYICNTELQHQPIGITGELFIGGINLSVGYSNQPELTEERFIENPFLEDSKLYRTGDLARWLPNGDIEFLGRIDNQVKIRGNRIELGEIELAIQSYKEVISVVVLTKERVSGLQLVAYIVVDSSYSEDDLRQIIENQLPEYMVPSYFITINEIPVTVNGKINRKALLALKIQNENKYVAPETALEKKIAFHWQQILDIKVIGIHDHFFRIGGDSILAIRLIGELNNELSITIAMVDIYENDTIEKMAIFIESNYTSNTTELYNDSIKDVELFGETYLKEYPNEKIEVVYPMSDIEKAMCFVHKSRPNDILYFEQLMQTVFYKNLNIKLLQKTLDFIVDKHEALRTGFNIEEFAHIVYKKVDTAIEFYDYSEYTEEEQNQKIKANLERSRSEHFDLDSEKLWRIIIYKIGKDHHEILFEYHHAILDGWSFASLLTEWNNTYVQLLKTKVETLPKLKATFKDYIVQQLHSKKNEEAKDFWKNELRGHKRLILSSEIEPKVFKSVRDIYPQQLLKDLEAAAQLGETTVKNMLLSAYVYAMKILSGENDILVGMVTFTRPLKTDGEKLLGCFLNSTPLRVRIPEALTWRDYISMIDKKVLEIKKYEHLSLFEINQLAGGSNEGNPLFDTHFNYINWHVKKDMLSEKFSDEENNRIEFDTFLRGNTFFDANYDVTNGKIVCMHEYSSPFMTKDMYVLYNDIFLRILSRMITYPNETINTQEFIWNPIKNHVEEKITDYVKENSSFEKLIPASYYQQKYWLERADKELNTTLPNIIAVLNFEEDVQVGLLKKSVQKVVSLYEVLRCEFIFKEKKLYQNIMKENHNVIKILTFENEQDVSEHISTITDKIINLNEPLFEANILQTKKGKNKLLLSIHRTIIDSYSLQKITEEIVNRYEALINNEELGINNFSANYSGFISWKKEVLTKLYPKMRGFWIDQLKDGIEPIKLPKFFSENNQAKYTAGSVDVIIPDAVVEKMLLYASKNNISPNMICMAAYKILLCKHTLKQNITIGSVEQNRSYKTFQNIIGNMENMMAIQSHISNDKTFSIYINELTTIYEKGLDHLAMPFEKLIDELSLKNQEFNSFKMNVLYQFEEVKNNDAITVKDLKYTWTKNYNASKSSDINLCLKKKENYIHGELIYNSNWFNKEYIDSFASQYTNVLNKLISSPETKISDIDILSDIERDRLVNEFNTTSVSFPKHNSILDIFESQVSKTPDNIAIIEGYFTLTYKEFYHNVRQMSSYLLNDKNVHLEDRVGIMLDREAYLISTIYGIMKSGCAYVPIDPKLPFARINAILKDAGIRVLVTRGQFVSEEILSNDIEIIDLDTEAKVIGQTSVLDTYPNVSLNNLAYVIYTSGSSGIPKGVMIEQGALLNTIQSMDVMYPLDSEDTFLFKTTHSFDISVAELFGWFHSGGKLSILPHGFSGDTDKILEEISRNKVTHINFVPSMFSVFMKGFKRKDIDKILSLKYIFLCGEVLPSDLIEDFNNLNTSIVLENIYGPTEATIYSSRYPTDDWHGESRVSIGKPLSNMKLFVVDSNTKLVPLGVEGELCIGGASLARGYMNNDSLTASKFIFSEALDNERIYKTGDLARWLPNGNMEYLGRIDDQVKIRGFRIELEEISTCLIQYTQISNSVVIVKEKEGDKFIIAYYTSDSELSSSVLREFLSTQLPDYMLPSFFVHLNEIPLNSNGKLDKKALPEPTIKIKEEYIVPVTAIEIALEEIWSEVLNITIDEIGVSRNFFELGGHSLKAMVLASNIGKAFNISFPLGKVFEKPTIKEQANFIEINEWLSNDKTKGLSDEMIEEVII